jgi:hypothetical protein
VIVSVAWDGDGHCLAATARGISYWDGARFCELSPPPVHPVHSLHRVGAGSWLLASDGGRLLAYSGDEATELLRCPDAELTITALDGNPNDMLVLLGISPRVGPVLHAAVGRHWLKPVVVDFAAAVSGVTRLGAEAWLVTGRRRDAGGFAAVFRPLEWRLDVVADASGGALVAAASQPELGRAVAVGANELWLIDADRVERRHVDEGAALSACDVDVLGGVWLAGSSTIWFVAADRAPVRAVHRDTEPGAPFISLHADVGRVVAVGVDGAVLEANAPGQS